MNRYNYVTNNPTTLTDYLGYSPMSDEHADLKRAATPGPWRTGYNPSAPNILDKYLYGRPVIQDPLSKPLNLFGGNPFNLLVAIATINDPNPQYKSDFDKWVRPAMDGVAMRGRGGLVSPKLKTAQELTKIHEDQAGGGVLKGPIPDEIPRTVTQQWAMDAAKSGLGRRIMADKIIKDAPRLKALYGDGEWVKMAAAATSKYNKDDSAEVHYFLNQTTGKTVEFKFK